MGSNQKQTQMDRKACVERALKNRLSFLAEKGIESPKIDKDTIVRKLRANIGAINARLKAIAGHEEKRLELANIKAEKAAAPRKEPEETKAETKTEKPKKAKAEKKDEEAPAKEKVKKKKKAEKEEAA